MSIVSATIGNTSYIGSTDAHGIDIHDPTIIAPSIGPMFSWNRKCAYPNAVNSHKKEEDFVHKQRKTLKL